MGSNFYTPWQDGTTKFKVSSMDPALGELDRAITYTRSVFITCDGEMKWDRETLTLTWDAPINIYFSDAAGLAKKNTIAATSKSIGIGQFVYVDLNETNDSALTMTAASITTGAACTFMAYNRVMLAFVNSETRNLYLINMMFNRLSTKQDAREQLLVNSSASLTVDWSRGSLAYVLLTQATTAITLSGGRNGERYTLRLVQDSGGSKLATWTNDIKWKGGSAPTLTTTADYFDIIEFIYSNGAIVAEAKLNYSGPAAHSASPSASPSSSPSASPSQSPSSSASKSKSPSSSPSASPSTSPSVSPSASPSLSPST